MENVIYIASPFQAFLYTILTIGFFFVLGIGGALLAIFRPKSERRKGHDMMERVGLGCASVVLLIAGVLTAFVSVNTFLTGDKTVVVNVDNKRIVESNCGNSKRIRTCTSYVLETHTGQKYIDFTVPKAVWDKMQAEQCYQFTYYPPQSLLGEYLQEDTSNAYETASNITRIETANCP